MYWIKQIEVLAGQEKFTNLGENGLEIEFDMPFNDKKEPDVPNVTIYNLFDATINDIKKDDYLYLNVGYEGLNNLSNVLAGEVEEAKTDWQGLDKVIKITVPDEGKKWRTAELNKIYKAGIKASQIMQDLASVLSYKVVEIRSKNGKVYKLGKTIKGKANKSLPQLVDDTESRMSINKNKLIVRGQKEGYQTGFVLNIKTGLIGIPTLNKDENGDKMEDVAKEEDKKKNKKTKKTWRVQCLLNPKAETDSIIKVEFKAVNGTFRVISGKHDHDSTMELEVEEV